MKRVLLTLLTTLLCSTAVADETAASVAPEAGAHPATELVGSGTDTVFGSGSCEAAGFKAPPKTFRAWKTKDYFKRDQVVGVEMPGGTQASFAGMVTVNVPGQCTGVYYWDQSTSTLTELGNGRNHHIAPLMVATEVADRHPAIRRLSEALSMFAIKRQNDAQVNGGSASPVAAPPREAKAEWATAPAIAAAAPTAAPVVTTVYREVQVPTPSWLAGLVESRLGWLLLGVLVIGIVAGFATRGSGSRQIVISPEEHARAAAALEQRLRADALRIQRLSSAVDEEEARFIQRVSAITGRS